MKIAEGRMIRKSISDSKKFAKLSPKAAVLYCMLIPHYNPHGKMNGGVGFVKEVICPRIKYLTTRMIPRFLAEISHFTAVKRFQVKGRWWIHAIKFNHKHQKLKSDRLGDDKLPSYPGLIREKSREVREKSGVCPPEVEVEGKGEEEVIDKTTPNPMRGGLRAGLQTATKPIPKDLSTEEKKRAAIKALADHLKKNGEK